VAGLAGTQWHAQARDKIDAASNASRASWVVSRKRTCDGGDVLLGEALSLGPDQGESTAAGDIWRKLFFNDPFLRVDTHIE
jgi:hypothetical protein